MKKSPLVAILCFAAVIAPLAASAQATLNYYTAPKLVKRGTSSSPIAGAGTVIVKVFVRKNGTVDSKQSSVLKSTNHGDDQAALEIALTSTYHPATKGTTKLDAFYDYSLKFTSGGVQTGTDTSQLAQDERMLRANNYSAAQADLKTYVQSHPGDQRALADLGIADTGLSDYADAVSAFDKLSSIAVDYRLVAARAYTQLAISKSNDKDYVAATALAKKAVMLSPTFSAYAALGYSEYAASDYDDAISDFTKASSLAASEKIAAKERALIDANLAAADVAIGKVEEAKRIAAQAKQLDPTLNVDNVLASYFVKGAQAKNAVGKFSEAAALFEQGAGAAPSLASVLYAQAAIAYLRVQPKPDNDKAKADADKSLAIDPNGALGLYAEGVALANMGKSKDALDFLKRADDASKKGTDPALTANIENAIKQLSGSK